MIVLNHVEIRYGDFVAVQDINFHVNKGEFFTLLGPSGCGKTTTLRAIAGFNELSKGKIELNQVDISQVPVEKRNIGMVFQSYALFPTMTVYDNIAYGLRVEKMPQNLISERVTELAKLVEIDEALLTRNVSELSGGQQQRVAIARALAKNNKVVLFDEPLSNLDAKLRKQLRAELKEIQQQTGMTAIYVTHDQEEALEMSDRIAVFNKGMIEQIGTPQEIYHTPQSEFTLKFIGESNLLSKEIMQLINQQLQQPLYSLEKNHYIRHENIELFSNQRSSHSIELPAFIEDIVFQGMVVRYKLNVENHIIYAVTLNDQMINFKKGQQDMIYINPDDIMEY